MEEVQKQIEHMVENMRFERKKRISKQEKATYEMLENSIDDIMRSINKLHLRLWHANHKKDYHSLSMDEISLVLQKMGQDIDTALTCISENNTSPDSSNC